MFGAIIGDIIGSTYEFSKAPNRDFILFPEGSGFTDDTIMTLAVANALIEWKTFGGDLKTFFVDSMRAYGRRYPNPIGGYGSSFASWLRSSEPQPYNSFGNGSAMRVSPCSILAQSLEEALDLAKQSAEVTHNHPEGIKGAQATAAAIYLAKHGADKNEIREYIRNHFYQLEESLDMIRPHYYFHVSCQRSVPESIQAFLESNSFEEALRNAVFLGGDADTMGAITGSIAWAFYGRDGISPDMQMLWEQAKCYLTEDLIECINEFRTLRDNH